MSDPAARAFYEIEATYPEKRGQIDRGARDLATYPEKRGQIVIARIDLATYPEKRGQIDYRS